LVFAEFALARALHVLGVVLWIGGVGFVTLETQPWARAMSMPVLIDRAQSGG
jgi:uncharacterized membrane protein